MKIALLNPNDVVISVADLTGDIQLIPQRALIAPDSVAAGHLYSAVTNELTAPMQRRWITSLAFWNRFTRAERTLIDLASERPVQGSDETPEAFAQRRQNAADLRDLRTLVDAAAYIDLDRTDTREGVLSLEAFGLIAAGRGVEILDAPIADHERHPDA